MFEIDERKTTSYNRDITLTDDEGFSTLVCRCYCTIVENETISYNITVEDLDVFNSNKETAMAEVEIYKQNAEALAKEYNVPVI